MANCSAIDNRVLRQPDAAGADLDCVRPGRHIGQRHRDPRARDAGQDCGALPSNGAGSLAYLERDPVISIAFRRQDRINTMVSFHPIPSSYIIPFGGIALLPKRGIVR